MKRFNYYLSLMLLLVFTAACNDEFDQPPMVIPTAAHTPNMTIAEFKAKYWQDAVNYIDTVKEDVVIHGWVTSSDESGNIYKSLYISDGTAGLNISINQNSMYNTYRIGQEIVIPLKDYFVGKYNGQQQLGYPQFYDKGGVWEATFLPQAMWESIVELNGLPNPAHENVQPVEVSISDFQGKADGETLMRYQGKLVRLSGVRFVDANGTTTFSEASGTTNHNVTDASGNTLVVRTSNYADFRADVLPEDEVDLVGLLSFYSTRDNASGTWQFYLRSIDDVIGGGGKGTRSNPITVAEAIEVQNTAVKGWVMGYAVGAVAPGVTTISGNSDVEWTAPTTMDNTLVLADDPDCKDISKCIVVSLPQGSPFREEANLKDNVSYYKTAIKVKGTFATYMGVAGITGNTGSRDEYVLPFARPVIKLEENFNGGLPTDWVELVHSGDKHWYYAEFNSDGYAAMTGYNGKQPPFDTWYITPPLDIKNAASKILTFSTETRSYGSTKTVFEVYIMNSLDPNSATVKVKLNPTLAKAPNSTGTWSSWTPSGEVDLSQWADGVYYIAFHYAAAQDSEYDTWGIDKVVFGVAPPPVTRADFETMGDAANKIAQYTSARGWVATNSYLFEGGTQDSNPTFIFIGYMNGSTSEYAKAPTLNGKTDAVGTLVSPVIKGGMKKLTFNYGTAFTDKLLSFRVDVKQGGNVVKTWTVNETNVARRTAYTFTEDCDVKGDFIIEVTNLCPSASTDNKDRVSIWNMTWDPAE